MSIRHRVGLAVSALPVLFLTFDAAIKLVEIGPVTESMIRLGLPNHLARVFGFVELVLLVLHLVPRTAVLGALLWVGFLGGAVAIHLRVGDPLATHTLFPVYVGVLLWLGLGLRRPSVAALVLARPTGPAAAVSR